METLTQVLIVVVPYTIITLLYIITILLGLVMQLLTYSVSLLLAQKCG